LAPSSIAEQQKYATYLTDRWNSQVESKMKPWMMTFPNTTKIKGEDKGAIRVSNGTTPRAGKDIFYYDLAQYILDLVIEHQLEDEGITDAAGLGKGNTPFEHAYQPCLHEADDDTEEFVDLNGQRLCRYPKEHMFWDAFNIGSVAQKGAGIQVASMVKDEKTMKKVWGMGSST
jgi:hypothetical protein